MKIFFPGFNFFSSNPGFAFKIESTVTLMFFARYSATMAESVSFGRITYSKPLSEPPP